MIDVSHTASLIDRFRPVNYDCNFLVVGGPWSVSPSRVVWLLRYRVVLTYFESVVFIGFEIVPKSLLYASLTYEVNLALLIAVSRFTELLRPIP